MQVMPIYKRRSSGDIFLIIVYLTTSTSLLIVNKLCLSYFNSPYTLTVLQLSFFCLILILCDILPCAPTLHLFRDKNVIASFILPGFMWSLPLAFCAKALQYLNPDSIIMFRVSTIFGVALCDKYLNRIILSATQNIALVMIFLGAALFSKYNWTYDLRGYFYGFLYMVSFIVSQVLTKFVFQKHTVLCIWRKAFYTNLFGSFAMFFMALLLEGFPVHRILELSQKGVFMITLSFFLGGTLSYVGSCIRDLLSATSFDVLGCAGKFFTIILSSYIFMLKYNNGMIFGIIVSISGSLVYSESFSPRIFNAALDLNRKGKRRFFFSIFLVLILCFWMCFTIFYSSQKKIEFSEPDSHSKSLKINSSSTSLETDIELWLRKQQNYDKYIILNPQGGFGNNFNAISSGLILAMLTDRALVIDWPGCAFDQFGPPLYELCLNQRLIHDVNFAKLYNKKKINEKTRKT